MYSLFQDSKNTWSGLIIINGRTRHPRTQGLVERGNQTLEAALGKWMQSTGSSEWSKGVCNKFHRLVIYYFHTVLGLAPVVYAINTSGAKSIKKNII